MSTAVGHHLITHFSFQNHSAVYMAEFMCDVHSQGSAGKLFVYFSGCQRPENRLEKLQDICKWRPIKPADSPNRMEDLFNQVLDQLKP